MLFLRGEWIWKIIFLTLLSIPVPPMVMVPSQLEGVPLGREVILECHVEAYPKAILYWTNGRGDMIISSKCYFDNNI